MIDGLLAALGLLTRIPVPARVWQAPGVQARSLPWYPLVGMLLGALLAALAWCLRDASPLLMAAMLVAAWASLTGGLHLDGLADSADAWVGGLGDRERTLAIMKDPRSGPAGVVALVLVLLLKTAALASLAASAWCGLWLAPLLARAALVAAFLALPYVRAGGMGAGLAAGAARLPCAIAVLATLLAALLAARMQGALAVLAAGVVFALWWRACRKRLGGMTGDTCGALVELVEVAVLVALAL
ncbi:adenosylcobinamide-GDP ribazoletransferase [[Pseudomonas] boreopolis]|uniref:adenosylcobinamide-GDP ribazoletransferase n=1 Tax=Xanthomonas boreopolis TaxID=86183 RepID=UPI003DA0FA3B